MAQATIKIRIKTIREDTFEVEINEDATVDELKEQIKEQKTYEINRQRLIFRGKVLKSGQKIQDYSIKNGDTLHLIVRREPATTARNDEPMQPEQMQSGSSSNRQARSQISVQIVSSTSDNANSVLQSVLSNFNASGVPSPQRGSIAAASSNNNNNNNSNNNNNNNNAQVVGTNTSVFDLRSLLNPSDSDTATNDESSSNNENENGTDSQQDIDMIDRDRDINILTNKTQNQMNRRRERRRARQRRQQCERQRTANNNNNNNNNVNSSNNNNNSNNSNNSGNATGSQVATQAAQQQGAQQGQQSGNNPLTAMEGGLEVDEGSGFSPVGLIPPILRTCHAMHLEIDRLNNNYAKKALGLEMKTNDNNTNNTNNNESKEDDSKTDTSTANGTNNNGNNVNNGNNGNTSNNNTGNTGDNGTSVEVEIQAVSVSTTNNDSTTDLNDLLNEFANQQSSNISNGTASTNANSANTSNNANNNNNNANNGINASNIGNIGGISGISGISGLGNNLGANVAQNANARPPRRHRREYLRHVMDVFERSEDIMCGNVDVSGNDATTTTTESKCKDDESGLTHELYDNFRENANGVMGFASHTMNELMKYQSQLKKEFKKLQQNNNNNNENENNNDSSNNANNSNQNQNQNRNQTQNRPAYQETEEMKQRRQELERMTKNAGQMLIEIGTVLGSLGHVMNKGVNLDPSNYDARGRIRIISDQSAHVIRTAVPVGIATSLSLDSSNPAFGQLFRSLMGAASGVGGAGGAPGGAVAAAPNNAAIGMNAMNAGNAANIGNIGNISNIANNIGNLGNLGNIANIANMGNIGNIGNIANSIGNGIGNLVSGFQAPQQQQQEQQQAPPSSQQASHPAQPPTQPSVPQAQTQDQAQGQISTESQEQTQTEPAAAVTTNANDTETKENENESGLTDMLDDVLANFDFDEQSDNVTTQATNQTTQPQQQKKQKQKQQSKKTEQTRPKQKSKNKNQNQNQNQNQRQRQTAQRGASTQQRPVQRQQQQSQTQRAAGQGQNQGLGGLLNMVSSMMGGGNPMAAMSGANSSNNSGNQARQRQPTTLAKLVLSFIVKSVGMTEMSSARQGNWDFLKYLRKNCANFLMSRLLENIDTPMRRHEICKDLSVGLGNIMIGTYSNDHRQVLYTITVNLFNNYLNALVNIVLDSENDSEFGKKLYDWGKIVLSEFIYKLSINFSNRDSGVKQYLSYLVKKLLSQLGGNVSVRQLNLIPDFVGYFVNNARSFHLKLLQTQRSASNSNSSVISNSSNAARLGQNEQWALQLTDENDRQRWLDIIRRDTQRMPIFVNEMRNHRFSDAYQGRVSQAVLQKRESNKSKE